MRKGKRKRSAGRQLARLSVVFDTNSVFTDSGFHLLSSDAKELILETRTEGSVPTKWLLPSVVLQEREFRLRERVGKLFQNIEEIPALVGHAAGVTLEEGLRAIEKRLAEELADSKIELVEPDWGLIEWDRVVRDATNRRPPFSPGSSEKGFRDAVIVETFLQIVSRTKVLSPAQKVVLVTSDELLQRAVSSRVAADDPVYPPVSLQDLKGLIATLAQEIEIELVNRLTPHATALFFTPGVPESLYIAAGVPSKLQTQYESAFTTFPPGADLRNTSAPSVSPSRFVKKEGTRFHWANQVIFPCIAYRITYPASSSPSSASLPSGTTAFPSSFRGTDDPWGASPSPSSFLSSSPAFQPPSSSSPLGSPVVPFFAQVSTGRTTFECIWSAKVSAPATLTEPKLVDIAYRGTDWS